MATAPHNLHEHDPYIKHGHDMATVTDKISSIVLARGLRPRQIVTKPALAALGLPGCVLVNVVGFDLQGYADVIARLERH